MCFSIAFIESTPKSYVENYKNLLSNYSTEIKEFPRYYFVSAFEYPLLPIVKNGEIILAQWGLIPSWVKTDKMANDVRKKTLNAKSETIFDKQSFRESILHKRAILGVTGFFEWQSYENKKLPYFITSKDNNWLSLGCIYNEFLNKETGELIYTFSIVTTIANELLSEIHNTKKRMPLILSKESETLWVNEKINVETIKSLMRPLPSDYLKAYKVSPFINNAKNNRNVPDAIKPI